MAKFLATLLRRQSLDVALSEAETSGYKRSLGPLDLTSIGVAAIIGAGIFALLGRVARDPTGPAVIVSVVIAGVASILAALAYAELASVLPGSGSAYTYAYAALGEMPAFLMGWLILNAYAVGNMVVAIVWSNNLTKGLAGVGISIPKALQGAPGTTADGVAGVFDLPAFLIVLLITGLCLPKVRESTFVNNLLVFFKLGVVLFFIGFGLFLLDPSNWAPFSPGGFSGVMRGAAVIFFAYLGFDVVAATAEEARQPRRDIPIGILGSVLISMTLYILMGAVITGMWPSANLDPDNPLSVAFDNRGYPWAGGIIILGALVATTTVIFAFQLALGRILQSMARDRFLPARYARLHPATGTPWTANLETGLLTALGAGLLPIEPVADMAVLASIVIYVLVASGVLALKALYPDTPRRFQIHWAFPVAAILLLVLMATLGGLPAKVHLSFLAWVGLGLALYGFYGHRRVAQGRLAPSD